MNTAIVNNTVTGSALEKELNNLSNIKIDEESKTIKKISALNRFDNAKPRLAMEEIDKKQITRMYKETPIEFGPVKDDKQTEKEQLRTIVIDPQTQEMARELIMKYKKQDYIQPQYVNTKGCRINQKSVFASNKEKANSLIPPSQSVILQKDGGINYGYRQQTGQFIESKLLDNLPSKRDKSKAVLLAKLPQPVYISSGSIVKEQVGANVFNLDERTIFDAPLKYRNDLLDRIKDFKAPPKGLDQQAMNENLMTDYGPAMTYDFSKAEQKSKRHNNMLRNTLNVGKVMTGKLTNNNVQLIRQANAIHAKQNNLFNTVYKQQ